MRFVLNFWSVANLNSDAEVSDTNRTGMVRIGLSMKVVLLLGSGRELLSNANVHSPVDWLEKIYYILHSCFFFCTSWGPEPLKMYHYSHLLCCAECYIAAQHSGKVCSSTCRFIGLLSSNCLSFLCFWHLVRARLQLWACVLSPRLELEAGLKQVREVWNFPLLWRGVEEK